MERELDSLAMDMFRTFARFEYALKAAGFHNGDGVAKANWHEFAKSVAESFDTLQAEDFKGAIAYILDHPPNKQMIVKGSLVWDPAVPQTDIQSDLVLIYVRRIRNNLFHGGKFNGRWFEPQRSEALLRHALTILNACLEISEPVSQAYHE